MNHRDFSNRCALALYSSPTKRFRTAVDIDIAVPFGDLRTQLATFKWNANRTKMKINDSFAIIFWSQLIQTQKW